MKIFLSILFIFSILYGFNDSYPRYVNLKGVNQHSTLILQCDSISPDSIECSCRQIFYKEEPKISKDSVYRMYPTEQDKKPLEKLMCGMKDTLNLGKHVSLGAKEKSRWLSILNSNSPTIDKWYEIVYGGPTTIDIQTTPETKNKYHNIGKKKWASYFPPGILSCGPSIETITNKDGWWRLTKQEIITEDKILNVDCGSDLTPAVWSQDEGDPQFGNYLLQIH